MTLVRRIRLLRLGMLDQEATMHNNLTDLSSAIRIDVMRPLQYR